MPPRLSFSSLEVRRIALWAQGFAARQGQHQPRHLLAMVDRLGALQLDSVNALVRSHYLPLYSRLGAYPREALDAMAWGSGRQRRLFEYWGHEASLLPVQLQPLLRWRMARAAAGQGIYQQLARFGAEQPQRIAAVLGRVQREGALAAGSLSIRQERAGPWWDWSQEKMALEWLFAAGEVTVAARRGFERLYDLPERVLPAAVLAQATPTVEEAQRQLLLHAAKALGVASEQDLRAYFRLSPGEARLRLEELGEAGSLLRCEVEGWPRPGWCMPIERLPRAVTTHALLSPFDSLLWERDRAQRLFGFRYRLEFYTPPSQRVYGYYVMPFLYQEQLLARVDLRAERATQRLLVHAVHEEPGGLSEDAVQALGHALHELAAWLGLERLEVLCQRSEGQTLRRTAFSVSAIMNANSKD
ncbi:crosslink repair DNA glycosylase YcaQ family protein [Pseudomonas sp. RIT-PI-S]|uniref:winged helix-turn-helix domain-containing protein n=1 Tax=Pseudomonas sp. RIT-PI-S TaxID=3035295 RepID=UPI0021D7DFF4|nr:crosslink repair DNA glycosylase YcaQ family protein [Pseudomonas sp. RIT-PI-S]